MDTLEFISYIRSLNIKLTLDGENLQCNAPKGVMTKALQAQLLEHKAEIIKFLQIAKENTSDKYPPIVPISRQQNLALSFSQQRFWFFNQLEANTDLYNTFQILKFQGQLNVTALEQSLNEIVRRHEVLRTIFKSVHGDPIQVILPHEKFNLLIVDLQALSTSEREAKSLEIVTEERKKPFSLDQGPLYRFKLLCLQENEHLFVSVIHHIVSDGWSSGVFREELSQLYSAFSTSAPSPLPELPIQYADFAHWQREWLQGQVLESGLNYWKNKLGGNLPILELPTDYPRPPIMTLKGTREYWQLPIESVKELKNLCNQEGCTLFMLLLAAFKVLLYRYTQQDDIIIGSPIAGRHYSDKIENLIGAFINTLTFRTDLSGNPTFKELLSRVKEVALGAYEYQYLPFDKLVETLNPERSLSHNPIFQVMFVLQNADKPIELPELTLIPVSTKVERTEFDLLLELQETNTGISGYFQYRTDLFARETISRMVENFQTLIAGIVANPQQPIIDLPIISAKEKQQLLVEWNKTQVEYLQDKCICKLFEEQVERTPNAIAVAFQEEQLTYQELNDQANQVAHYLTSLNIGLGSYVPVLMDRSLGLIVALLAVMKTGAAFSPLDIQWPVERLKQSLEDLNCPFVLVNYTTPYKEEELGFSYLVVDEVGKHQSTENLNISIASSDPIYVIYTSGSTGKPKGAVVPHRGIINRFLWMNDFFGSKSAMAALQTTRHVYDSAVWQFFWPLINGGKTVIPSPDIVMTADIITTLIQKQAVTITDFVPSVFNTLVPQLVTDTEVKEKLSSLQTVIVGGEEITPATTYTFRNHFPGVKVVNLYGPTEASIGCICHEVIGDEGNKIPIGKPISNVHLLILDSQKNLVPIGVAGELYLSGICLGIGYLNDETKTNAAFVDNPYPEIGYEKCYKTGDLVRYLPNGSIDFLGRIDYQVKIRGFRIELGEIEATLNQHPAVQEILVISREDSPGEKRIVAYVVADTTWQNLLPQTTATSTPDAEDVTASLKTELRSFLAQKLPNYMIPSAFVFLESLPLSPNGKVNRRALPAPDYSRQNSEESFVAPSDGIELELTKIWENILGITPIGIRDNFFELGGHSLLAVRLFAEIEKTLGKNLPLATLFQKQTIEELAILLRKPETSQEWNSLVMIQKGNPSKPPLFCIHAIWGNVLFYRKLALYLNPEQPFYALQSRGLDGKQTPFNRIEDMAKHYIEEIRTVQPKGPYFLGGYSIGGVIAFEMAQQLYTQGEKVAFLGLFDSGNPNLPSIRPSLAQTLWIHLSRISKMKPADGWQYIWDRIDYRFGTGKNHKKFIKDFMIEDFTQTETLTPIILKILENNQDSSQHYRAQVYPEPINVALFRSEFQSMSRALLPPELGWDELVSGNIEIHTIPGDHGMFNDPQIQIVGEKLQLCLERSQADNNR